MSLVDDYLEEEKSRLARLGLSLVDETLVKSACKKLEGFADGRITTEECQGLLVVIERELPGAREFTGAIRRLIAKKRIDNLALWRSEFFVQVTRIKMRASAHNIGAKLRAEELQKFRVEMVDPIIWNHGPLVFHARIYIDEEFCLSIECIVSEKELDDLPISSRSLSKRKARERRINDYYQSFCTGFQLYLERRRREGADIKSISRLTWSEVCGR